MNSILLMTAKILLVMQMSVVDQKQKSEPEIRFPLVVIEWLDHQTADGWFDSLEEALETFKLCVIHSVGWLCHEDATSYIVASMICLDESRMSMLTQILKGSVVSKKVLCP
jgi:hypothetical protein